MTSLQSQHPLPRIRRRLDVRGVVQGVGYRPFVYGLAQEMGLAGWVMNDEHGVAIEVEGPPLALAAFERALVDRRPTLASVAAITARDLPAQGSAAFRIDRRSGPTAGSADIPPDVGLCAECRRELFDPTDRRYRYPFINCTACGPRFTVITCTPYERSRTTMVSFAMCDACAAEYNNPASRRFHAEPIACPACGPRVWFEGRTRHVDESNAALAATISALKAGAIVAIKGIGGFHLACDATNDATVARLRERKHRVAKPLAIMVRDVNQAKDVAIVGEADAAQLTSPARPIVLLRACHPSPVSAHIAPGLDRIGVMLPYSPLHELLVDAMPVVLTSGNVSDEPIAIDNDEARDRLGDIADAFLFHDRPIQAPCDDSVILVSTCKHRVSPLRRSRGFAPRPIGLGASGLTVLATGGDLKATACLAIGDRAIVTPHLGDQGDLRTHDAFEAAVGHLLTVYAVEPDAIATDLHPGYASVAWARRWSEAHRIRRFEIQHHHAHIASVLAEHRRGEEERVIGVAFDGTGYGTDGTIWGGEVFVASMSNFERVGHLSSTLLPGGDAAARKPSRSALAWLTSLRRPWDVDLPPVRTIPVRNQVALRRQYDTGIGAVRTTSAGRLFDALASLLDVCQDSRYEGEAAMRLEAAANGHIGPAYPFTPPEALPFMLHVAPLVDGVIADRRSGVPVAESAARVHGTIAELIASGCRAVRRARGVSVVALSGGVFQNMLLTDHVTHLLETDGFDVLVNREVPPNDGGLSLGQAAIARALLHHTPHI